MIKKFSDPSPTLAEVGTERLAALCRAVGFDAAQAEAAQAIFRRFAIHWGGRRVHAGPPQRSDITDDHTPFEFSIAIDGGAPELRFLVEVQGDQPSLAAHWTAAAAINRGLAADFGAELERLRAVAELFAPTAHTPRFALWHAVCLTPGAPPSFKVYLNPQARGVRESAALVKAALTRLGFGAAFAQLPVCKGRDSYIYFSLDLSGQKEARVKIYTAHHDALSTDIEAAVAGAEGHVAGQAREFCVAMAQTPGPYALRPVLTCLSFVQGRARPSYATVHFPVRAYADDDQVIKDRVLRYLGPQGAAPYTRALAAFARRPLAAGIGMQTYVSLRINKGIKRLTVYLAAELFTAERAELPVAL
ncbi:MAG TPA: tryptophan dimethylallyltransferase family protein [Pseudomonadota bacterium]|nr:tryptophan dimethylallyltransferase family protein [Pseudomonadota bacterium]